MDGARSIHGRIRGGYAGLVQTQSGTHRAIEQTEQILAKATHLGADRFLDIRRFGFAHITET